MTTLCLVFSSTFAEGMSDASQNDPNLDVNSRLDFYEYKSDSDLDEVDFSSEMPKDAALRELQDLSAHDEKTIVKAAESEVSKEIGTVASVPSTSTTPILVRVHVHEVLHDQSVLIVIEACLWRFEQPQRCSVRSADIQSADDDIHRHCTRHGFEDVGLTSTLKKSTHYYL